MEIVRKLRVVSFCFFVSLLLYLPAFSQPFAYITGESSNDVSVVDLATNTEVAVIPVCASCGPYWIAVSANQSLVAASLQNGVALIDPATMSLIGVVSVVGSEPEAVAINSTGTTVYVADESWDNLFVVDVASQTVTAGPIDLDPSPPNCDEPENMVITPDDNFMFITCAGSQVIRVNLNNFNITSIATGLGDPHGIAIDSTGTFMYYTDGTDAIQHNIATSTDTGITFSGCGMYNGAVSPSGDRLYCVTESNNLRIYTTSNGNLVQNVTLAFNGSARGVAVSPDESRAFVPIRTFGPTTDTLTVVDTTTFAVSQINLSSVRPRDVVIVAALPVGIPIGIPTMGEIGAFVLILFLGIAASYRLRFHKHAT